MTTQSPASATNALRLTAALLLAFAGAFLVYYGINTLNDPVFAIDFSPYYVAGQLVARGEVAPLTAPSRVGMFATDVAPFLKNFQKYFFHDSPLATGWVYLPGYAWLFRPFADLDFPTAARVWLGVNVILLGASIALVLRARLWRGDPQLAALRVAWIIFLGLTFQPMLDNLWHGNVSILILFCFCAGYYFLRREQPLLAGLALGLIVPLKFYPALIVLYFVWRRDWRVVIGAAISSLALVTLSWFTVGANGMIEYAQKILGELGAGGVPAFNNQSLAGFLLHAFTFGDVNGWQDMAVPMPVTVLRYALILGLLGAVAWAMRRAPEKTGNAVLARDFDLALVIGVMLIASPITWYHYYVWLFLPVVIVLDYFLMRAMSRRQLFVFALAYGLIVVQGIAPIRAFAAQAIQDVWLLRVLLSTSFCGAAMLIGLILRLRAEQGVTQ
jgi:hypothetical protein